MASTKERAWPVVCSTTLNWMKWSFAFDSLPVKHFWLWTELVFFSQPRQAVGRIFPGHPWGHFLVRFLLKLGPALRNATAVKHTCADAFPDRTNLETLALYIRIPGLRGRKQGV